MSIRKESLNAFIDYCGNGSENLLIRDYARRTLQVSQTKAKERLEASF